jgi:hypothetical protein
MPALVANLRRLATLAVLAGGLVAAAYLVAPRSGEARGTGCVGAKEHALPLPTAVAAAQFVDYEKQILAFLQRGDYKALGWCVDKAVRDTGPFIDGVYYGTHPSVRIYYSPKVMGWLLAGRQGTVPDGAMIIKEVKDDRDKIVWASGRTNRLGIIVDGNGDILPSEFFSEYLDAQGDVQQHYQPHHEVITAQDQVQIYEELTKNSDGRFTTNFTRRFAIVKHNRLLPIGWTEQGPDPSLNGRFLEATHAEGSAAHDPDYHNGLGTDRLTYRMTLPAGVDAATCTVQATLYCQATPPFYLDQRFKAAPDGQATKRLYYLASNLKLTGSPAEHWKLPIVSTTAPVSTPSLVIHR